MPKQEKEKLMPKTDAELMTAAAEKLISNLKAKLPLVNNQRTREGFQLAIAALKEVLDAKIKKEAKQMSEQAKQEDEEAWSRAESEQESHAIENAIEEKAREG